MKTSEKVLLAILVVTFIGMASAFMTALNSESKEAIKQPSVKVLYSDDLEMNENDDEAKENEDVAITGDDLDKASAAALSYIGQGRVTDSEVGDEEGYYEIEVTLNNGKEIDVHLDEEFNVISVEYN